MKIVKEERLVLVIELVKSDEGIEINSRADYQVQSEDLSENRSLSVSLNRTYCLALGKEALQQIKDKEA